MKYKDYLHKVLAKDKYAVLDPEGKVLIKFRGKNSALYWARKEQRNYFKGKLSVVPL